MENKSDNLKQKWNEALISTFDAFRALCSEYDLRYYGIFGTGIGAVRHKGMIPWDDDIDVGMPRPDYEKLILVCKEQKLGRFRLVTPENDNNYFLPYAKFCDWTTTLVEFRNIPCRLGVFIDVFPLDGCSEVYDIGIRDYQKIRKLKRYYSISSRKYSKQDYFSLLYHLRLKELFVNSYYRRFSHAREKLLKRMKSICMKENYDTSSYIISFYSGDGFDKLRWKKGWFTFSKDFEFEKTIMRIPFCFHELLKQTFGEYMIMPPIEKQVSHHSHYYLNLKEGLSLNEVKERIKRGETLVY